MNGPASSTAMAKVVKAIAAMRTAKTFGTTAGEVRIRSRSARA